MTTCIFFYNEPIDYDTDVLYDGFCPQEEISFIATGKSQKSTEKKEYCYIKIDLICCYVNGELISCNSKSIKFEYKEELNKIPFFIIDSIKLKNNSKPNMNWFVVSDYRIKSTNMIVEIK